jgi:hypothetical protein
MTEHARTLRKPAERPILFKAPMVRAILAGRKTQTRRIVTVPWQGRVRALPYGPYYVDTDGELFVADDYGDYHRIEDWTTSPCGRPGDRLWVRETWRTEERHCDRADGIRYRADDDFVVIDDTPEAADRWIDAHKNGVHANRWRPSIFMPRALSRILLHVASVRVERVQAISEEDARAEGVNPSDAAIVFTNDAHGRAYRVSEMENTHRGAFACLWDSLIDEKDTKWNANPWVWRIGFEVVAMNRTAR